MKIGKLVQHYIPNILGYCEKQDHKEFERLCDRAYSKSQFDINFPFFKPVSEISASERMRYWSNTYIVRGTSVRVTSQWFDLPTAKSRSYLIGYLERLGIAVSDSARDAPDIGKEIDVLFPQSRRSSKGRYKGNAIGNAQNLLVRNILSNFGSESFGAEEWQKVISEFENRCAYCGQDGELLMDHVVPINKQSLGEHRLGNLVPSCKACNTAKSDKDFREYLLAHPERIAAIEAHMERHNYIPIGENEQIRRIIELAHKEVAQVAQRYIDILDTLMPE